MKLSKQKQNQLLLTVMGTAIVLGALWYFVIRHQQQKIVDTEKRITTVQKQLDETLKIVKFEPQVDADLQQAGARLEEIEAGLPSGDLFSWILSRVKQFNAPSYKVDMPQFGQPVVSEVAMIPGFPYRQASVNVGGTAFYYDFGKFLADFENHFPYMRVQNLSLDPTTGGSADEKEKLGFRMDILTLVNR
jgi:Tfp pilus assembly protein PilO